MIWIDASVWLEIALKQEKEPACKQFLASVAKERLFLADFDFYSIVITMMKHKKKTEDIKTFLGVLSGFPHMTVFRPSPLLIDAALEGMATKKLTFDDSLTYACMQHLGMRKLATLDQDFRKLDVEYMIN